ncbi:E3 ubiquitin-protein ligase RHA2A-like [Zingiber officinale]|uniref:E3 ubiquitin-protein ligase RHA2A-like n=1 Tax=Zingiber officinale TaxID=94328 RepID=UPI001C4D91DD|nr:E3 ubiquitin-protein ligase RHA2A-like [Zingiber officinale]
MNLVGRRLDLILVPKPVLLLIYLLHHVEIATRLLLSCLGIYSPPAPDVAVPEWYHGDDHGDGVGSRVVAASIKRQLRVVEYSLWAKRWGGGGDTCVICLGEVEAAEKVRELANCRHSFHVDCIDRWVDAGHVSCPLCRAPLLCRCSSFVSIN